MRFNDNFFAALSATWYLSIFSWQSTTLAALLPVIFTLYITAKRALLKKERESAISINIWGIILIGYGAYSCLTVYLNDGNNRDYETALKFIFGGLLVQQFGEQKIDIKFVIAGALIGIVAATAATWLSYDGHSRFSLISSSGKWGQSMAILTILLMSLCLIVKNKKLQVLICLAAIIEGYITSLSSLRGALLAILVSAIILLILQLRKCSPIKSLMGLFILILIIASATQLNHINSRLSQAVHEINQISTGNMAGSIGTRLTMWQAGFQNGILSPIIGNTYNSTEVWDSYESDNPTQTKVKRRWSQTPSRMHNTYIDTFVSKGAIGLGFIILILVYGFRGLDTNRRILMIAPLIGTAVMGLTSSTFDTNITVVTLIILGAIIRAIRFNQLD